MVQFGFLDCFSAIFFLFYSIALCFENKKNHSQVNNENNQGQGEQIRSELYKKSKIDWKLLLCSFYSMNFTFYFLNYQFLSEILYKSLGLHQNYFIKSMFPGSLIIIEIFFCDLVGPISSIILICLIRNIIKRRNFKDFAYILIFISILIILNVLLLQRDSFSEDSKNINIISKPIKKEKTKEKIEKEENLNEFLMEVLYGILSIILEIIL